jgi:hypothetical protein
MPRLLKDTAGAEILTMLETTFGKYVALDVGLPFVLTLWTLATHVFGCFDAFPYLAITSPTKRCGKTRLAEIVELYCANGLRTVGATSAAMFRSIQACSLKEETLTLILDEAEVLGKRSDRSESLREILNAGYRRGQYVLRCEPSEAGHYEPQQFSVYCPKVIVLIGNLTDTLADRCIPISMRRRKPSEEVARFFYSQAARDAKRSQSEMKKWVKANSRRVTKLHRQDLKFLEDREAELWLPLFSVCRAVAPHRVEQLKVIALGISGRKLNDEPAEYGVLLLRDIRNVFANWQQDRLPTAALVGQLTNIEESPWATWGRGKGLDARGLSRLLRPFRIEPHNIRLEDNQIVKGYMREDFAEAWATYLPGDAAATPLQGA